jgi:hypothetical protein
VSPKWAEQEKAYPEEPPLDPVEIPAGREAEFIDALCYY